MIPFYIASAQKMGDGSYVVRVLHNVDGTSTDVIFPYGPHAEQLASEYTQFKNWSVRDSDGHLYRQGIVVPEVGGGNESPDPVVQNESLIKADNESIKISVGNPVVVELVKEVKQEQVTTTAPEVEEPEEEADDQQ